MTLLRDPVDHWADTRPDAPAMTFGDRTFTWASWHDPLLRLTCALRAAGVGRGDRIAVLDLNHLATVELTLAASALGAATAIVNSRLAPEQIAYVLEDSAPVLLFHGPGFADAPAKQRIAIADAYEPFLAAGPPDDARDAGPDDPCLVMYTSGTTGQPKGAQLTHRGVRHDRAVRRDHHAEPAGPPGRRSPRAPHLRGPADRGRRDPRGRPRLAR